MNIKRLTLFAGHYGSGKTNISLNYAYMLKEMGLPVTIADLDIVNPYFRTKDSEDVLREKGIALISSKFANSNLDVPSMPKEIYALIDARDTYGVLDIGGDDRGALALGRYAADIKNEDNYEMLFVINKARPLTADVNGALEIMHEIETACGLHFTAVVNNTNLGAQTSCEFVLDSAEYANAVCAAANLPLKMTCVSENIYNDICKIYKKKVADSHDLLKPANRFAGHKAEGKLGHIFPLSIQKLYYMINTEVPDGKINI